MKNYMLLYGGGKMADGETQQKAVIKDWEAWYGKIGKGLVDTRNPFTPMAKRIASDGKVSEVAAGAMASG